MAKRKHKAKPEIAPVRREPNGRAQRPSVKELQAMERARAMKETEHAKAQPHRRAFPSGGDTRAESPFGRFCLRNNLMRDLEDAGIRWRDQIRSWRIAAGLICPFGFGASGDDYQGAADIELLLNRWVAAFSAMEKATMAGAMAIGVMCRDNAEIPEYLDARAVKALEALARHYSERDRRDNAKHGAGVRSWRGHDNVFIVDEPATGENGA